jgi:hypothetical protein
MRRFLLATVVAFELASAVGCIVPIYAGDPADRTQELIFTSENLRFMREEWERIWFLDQPSHLSPYRTHGGLI